MTRSLFVTRFARAERLALCDTFEDVGPDAPTLCHPWRTAELAAHLVIRETRPDLALGMLVPALADRLDEAIQERAGQEWASLVDDVRQGPPLWTPAGLLAAADEAMNTMEMFIHHEDVRRAAAEWEPRELATGHAGALWSALRRSAGLLYRRAEVGVVLVADGLGRAKVREPGEGHGTVVVRGPAPEVALFSFGRKDVALVDLKGADRDVAALRRTDLSIP